MKKEIYLAGGCFWGVEEFMSRLPGVESAESGYANSRVPNPTYEQVCSGRTGAAETVRVVYDPDRISLANLLRHYFSIINPLSLNRQGNDQGTQYRTGVFYPDVSDKSVIEEVFAEEQGKYGLPLMVEMRPLENFWPAEEYHQDYLKKNPGGYCHINLDRSGTLKLPKAYPGPGSRDLRRELTPMQYAVTQENQTEPPFTGEHWNRHEKGIYVDVVTGEPLFSSADKFDSGTGWASFTAMAEPGAITGHMDTSHGMKRIEARSKFGNSHLGHIFPDGPSGLRYCINDAALRFVPASEMESQGYGYLMDKVEKK